MNKFALYGNVLLQQALNTVKLQNVDLYDNKNNNMTEDKKYFHVECSKGDKYPTTEVDGDGVVVEGIHTYIEDNTLYIGVNKKIYREKYTHIIKRFFQSLV